MARFSGIPSVPITGLEPAQARLFSAIKENVELLTGQRGTQAAGSAALTRDQINIRALPEGVFRNVTAQGDGFNIQGSEVVALADYRRALDDIQRLAQDVRTLREYVSVLTNQLRG